MKTYMYENTYTQELENAVESDKAKPVIEEMFHRYGLKVMATKPYATIMKEKYWWNQREDVVYPNIYIMTLDGIGSCGVYATRHNDTDVYGVVFDYDVKDRYSNTTFGGDRSCLTSNKISTLMKNIETRKAIYSNSIDSNSLFQCVINTIESKVKGGSGYKGNRLDGDSFHSLLESYVKGIPLAQLDVDLKNEIEKCLTEYRNIDNNRNTFKEALDRFFNNELYMVGSDKNDGYVIGKIKPIIRSDLSNFNRSRVDTDYEVLESFRRIADLNEYENKDAILPVMTMLKLSLEGKERSVTFRNTFFTDTSQVSQYYGEDLNAGIFSDRNITSFNCQWIIIPTESKE